MTNSAEKNDCRLFRVHPRAKTYVDMSVMARYNRNDSFVFSKTQKLWHPLHKEQFDSYEPVCFNHAMMIGVMLSSKKLDVPTADF